MFYFSLKISYFGLKYYGECWSGKMAGQTYSRDRSSDSCVRGVGQRSSYFVYKFYDYGNNGKSSINLELVPRSS